MAIYWGTTRGVLQLAEEGPRPGSRIGIRSSQPVTLTGVTLIVNLAPVAAERFAALLTINDFLAAGACPDGAFETYLDVIVPAMGDVTAASAEDLRAIGNELLNEWLDRVGGGDCGTGYGYGHAGGATATATVTVTAAGRGRARSRRGRAGVRCHERFGARWSSVPAQGCWCWVDAMRPPPVGEGLVVVVGLLGLVVQVSLVVCLGLCAVVWSWPVWRRLPVPADVTPARVWPDFDAFAELAGISAAEEAWIDDV